MILSNPEFRRYAWGILNPVALLLPTVILGLFLFTMSSYQHIELEPFYLFMVAAAVLLVILPVSTVVSTEIKDRTWDFQRMLPLNPVYILLGKWAGASLYGWYVLAVFKVGHIILLTMGAEATKDINWSAFYFSVFVGSLVSLSIGTSYIRSQRDGASASSIVPAVTGTFYAGYFYALYSAVVDAEGPLSMAHALTGTSEGIKWVWINWHPGQFIFALTFAYTAWIFYAAVSVLRSNMRHKTTNSPVLMFLVFNTAVFLGFIPGIIEKSYDWSSPVVDWSGPVVDWSSPVVGLLLTMSASNFAVALGLIFYQPLNIQVYRRVLIAYHTRQWEAVFNAMPSWVFAVGVGLVGLIATCFMAFFFTRPQTFFVSMAVMTIAIFFLRDFAFAHAFVYLRNEVKSSIPFFMCLVSFYIFVLPFLPYEFNPFRFTRLLRSEGLYHVAFVMVGFHVVAFFIALLLVMWRWKSLGVAPPVDKSVSDK